MAAWHITCGKQFQNRISNSLIHNGIKYFRLTLHVSNLIEAWVYAKYQLGLVKVTG